MRHLAIAVVMSVLLVGCTSTPEPVTLNPYPALHDELFPTYELFPVETEEDVFALGEDAKAFVKRATTIISGNTHHRSVKSLISSIFDHSEMGLLYRSNANSTAESTFANRAANCLSLSIMTYAMAKHAGFKAQFYEVDIPEYWTRREGFSFLNGHVNLRISIPDDPTVTSIGPKSADVDFDPQMMRKHFPRIQVSKTLVLAMFYNNKGADALVANSYTRAYSYFRAAAMLAPELQQSWVNLGVLYRMVDAFDAAEQSYEYALTLNDDNLTAWENLSILFHHKGQKQKAEEIQAMVKTRRKSNPFYHFILGEQAFDEGNFEQALTYYQRAFKLDNSRHEVLFGLSKVYWELGDISKAESYLQRAAKFAPNQQDEVRYMSKLSTLASN
ncbi:tetratricopeptide repeat protein [Alteromonas sp. 345S023]|uniref:Tetratricopeptide repeat protein n=1 Tax=Alteromonas profundi TaxID=2696062 RepID=A0A7X5LPD3_9ALTE|nr:tetratricopeptide repeat protein [Alteromonas profundi]NDV92305.1 tetratricopeptide repeat protein [Alteromonas profundi]